MGGLLGGEYRNCTQPYSLPRMCLCIDSIRDALIFSTPDANRSCWKVDMEDANRDETAFTSYYGLYRVFCMPFGLCNATGTFQQTMDVNLSSVELLQTALVYLDYITIFSRTTDEQIECGSTDLLLLHGVGVSLNLRKGKIFTEHFDYYLGCVFRPVDCNWLLTPRTSYVT